MKKTRTRGDVADTPAAKLSTAAGTPPVSDIAEGNVPPLSRDQFPAQAACSNGENGANFHACDAYQSGRAGDWQKPSVCSHSSVEMLAQCAH